MRKMNIPWLKIIAIYSVLCAAAVFYASGSHFISPVAQGAFFSVFATLLVIEGALLCVVAFGLWTLKKWGHPMAFWLFIIRAALDICYLGIGLVFINDFIIRGAIGSIGIVLGLCVINYISKQEVIAQFSKASASI